MKPSHTSTNLKNLVKSVQYSEITSLRARAIWRSGKIKNHGLDQYGAERSPLFYVTILATLCIKGLRIAHSALTQTKLNWHGRDFSGLCSVQFISVQFS